MKRAKTKPNQQNQLWKMPICHTGTRSYPYGYLYAQNYQIWCRFDELLTKTSWEIFLAYPVHYLFSEWLLLLLLLWYCPVTLIR